MLVVVKVIIAAGIWMLIPVLLGSLWNDCGRKMKDMFIWTYLMGIISEWALFFVIAKWAIARQITMKELSTLWVISLAVLVLIAIVIAIRNKCFSVPAWKMWKSGQMIRVLVLILLCAFAMVCGGSRQKEHTVEAALTMYATDTLYEYDAVTGRSESEMLSFEKAELERDASAPIEAYYAVNSWVCRLDPAKVIRILLPFFLLPFYFCVYQMWANALFPESGVKRALFQTVVWLLYSSAGIAGWNPLFDILSNCWNGETLFFAGLLPFAVWLQFQNCNKKRWFLQYMVCALAGQLLYEKGAFLIIFLWIVTWFVTAIRRWKNG